MGDPLRSPLRDTSQRLRWGLVLHLLEELVIIGPLYVYTSPIITPSPLDLARRSLTVLLPDIYLHIVIFLSMSLHCFPPCILLHVQKTNLKSAQ